MDFGLLDDNHDVSNHVQDGTKRGGLYIDSVPMVGVQDIEWKTTEEHVWPKGICEIPKR